MSWKALAQSIATHLVVALIAYFLGWATKPAPEITTIDLTATQKQQIVQNARIGYITLDSAKAMIKSESRIKWITETRLTTRDSLVIRDSVNIIDSVIYIPVYEAPDTLIAFNEITDKAEISLTLKLKQRFFPLQERFASELQLMSLNVDIPKPEPSFWTNRVIVYAGLGVNYNMKDFSSGFQLGIGIRVW